MWIAFIFQGCFLTLSCGCPKVGPALDIESEPRRESVRCLRHFLFERSYRYPACLSDLIGVQNELEHVGIGRSSEHVDSFMFGKAIADISAILNDTNGLQRQAGAQFVLQTAMCASGDVFVPVRMATAGVGPKTTAMVFVMRTALDQQLPGRAEHKHRYRQMQHAQLVRSQFFYRVKGAVIRDGWDGDLGHRSFTLLAVIAAFTLAILSENDGSAHQNQV